MASKLLTVLCHALHVLALRRYFREGPQPGQVSFIEWVMQLERGAEAMVMCTGVSLTALAEAAQLGALGGQAGSPLLSEAAKAAGVPCSPAQLYFLALEQVRLQRPLPWHTPQPPGLSKDVWLSDCSICPSIPSCFSAFSSLSQA